MREKNEFYFYAENLSVGYHGVPLIKNIKIGVKRGEILTLIGPNGAGKTTILKSIIRQLAPVAGVMFLDWKNMLEITTKDLSEKLSVVLTDRIRPELMSCGDVVATGRYPYTGKFGVLSAHDRAVVRETMELVHILKLADMDFDKVSDGQKQRVMLARALCQEPDLIVLDEPTSFLDIRYKLEFLSILQKLARERNLSVIMSLHELDFAARISDKIACIDGERIDHIGSPEEIFKNGYIPKLFHMTVGSYDGVTGNLELEAVRGESDVFVIAGCGTGTPIFRRLQREGVPFAVGILYENDIDYPCAKALACEVISLKPFTRCDEVILKRALAVRKKCSRVICTLDLKQTGFLRQYLEKLL